MYRVIQWVVATTPSVFLIFAENVKWMCFSFSILSHVLETGSRTLKVTGNGIIYSNSISYGLQLISGTFLEITTFPEPFYFNAMAAGFQNSCVAISWKLGNFIASHFSTDLACEKQMDWHTDGQKAHSSTAF